MMFNFTNSSIDLKASNGYVFETESNIPLDWFSSYCNEDYDITGIYDTSQTSINMQTPASAIEVQAPDSLTTTE